MVTNKAALLIIAIGRLSKQKGVDKLLQAISMVLKETDCESNPREILKDGIIGKLVPVSDIDGVATAILDSLSHPLDFSLLKQRCSNFVIDKIGAKYLKLLKKATALST